MASRKQRPQALGPVTAADVIVHRNDHFVPEGKFVGHQQKLPGLAEGHFAPDL